MTFIKTYDLNSESQLLIKLPKVFRSTKKIRVIIEKIDEDRDRKIKMIAKAASDPLFLMDVKEITEDFMFVDIE